MRGISSAMWSSVSGLQGYGAQLGTIGTNIANSGSIGYRGTTTYLTGGFSGHLAALSGAETMAQGVAVSSVYTNFASGVGLSTTSSRHMAISGTGMFGVRQPNSEEILFTRRGDFEFNVDGYLSTPEGYRVQGWPIDSNLQTAKSNGQMSSSSIKGTGQPTDIRSPGDTSPPKATTVVEIVNNLGASDEAVIPLEDKVLGKIGDQIFNATKKIDIENNSEDANNSIQYNQPVILTLDGKVVAQTMLNLSKRGVKVISGRGIIP